MLNKFLLAAAVFLAVASCAPVHAQRGGASPADQVRAAETAFAKSMADRQTREIGIRMALGASQGEVLRMVGAMGLRLIGIGAAIGLLASFGATKVIASR